MNKNRNAFIFIVIVPTSILMFIVTINIYMNNSQKNNKLENKHECMQGKSSTTPPNVLTYFKGVMYTRPR